MIGMQPDGEVRWSKEPETFRVGIVVKLEAVPMAYDYRETLGQFGVADSYSKCNT